MLRGHVFSEQVFGNEIFALFINQFLGGHNGIIEDYKNAMEMTNTNNSITVDSGAVVIQGRYVEEHTQTIINYAKTDSLYCSLVIEIDLNKTNTRTSLEQAYYKVLESESGYPTLTKEDIINQHGIYQFELARFQNGATGITNFTDRRSYLSFDSVYSGIIKDNLESTSTTSALSANQGRILKEKILLAAYEGGTLDPNTTLEPLILTQSTNGPDGGTNFYYIKTYFYGSISTDRPRSQVAIGYRNNNMYQRYFFNNAWSEWSLVNDDFDWETPVLQNNWVDYGGSFENLGFKKIGKTIKLKGIIKGGTINTTIFQFPSNYRLIKTKVFPVICSNQTLGELRVQPGGAVVLTSGNNSWVSVDGIEFNIN